MKECNYSKLVTIPFLVITKSQNYKKNIPLLKKSEINLQLLLFRVCKFVTVQKKQMICEMRVIKIMNNKKNTSKSTFIL